MNDFRESWKEKKPGLMARVVSALRKTSNSIVIGNRAIELSTSEAITELLPNTLLRGWSVPVVGESFYVESFRRLYELSSTPGNESILRTATIRIDPENPNSQSGKAVAVFIQGHKVGHIAERICSIVFDGLERLGGSAECECSIYFDESSGQFRYNSVELHMILPPTLASESTSAKVASLKTGLVTHRVGVFRLNESAGSLLKELTPSQVIFLTLNFSGNSNSLEVATVDGQTMFTSEALESPLPFAMPPDGTLFYIETKALALGDGAFELYILGSDPVKAEKTRTGDSVSEAGNVLSSRYELGLIPSGTWLKVKYDNRLLQAPGSALFTPDSNEVTKYFWARVTEGSGLWSPLGFRGNFYQADVEKFMRNMKSVPSFWLLVRASQVGVSAKPLFEVALNADAEFTLFPMRPVLPSKALTSNKLSPPVNQSPRKATETVIASPRFSSNVSLLSMNDREIATSGLDILELNYLMPVLETMGYHFGDSVTKSRTGLLIGGSDFDLEDSGKARTSTRFGIPIISVMTLREQLATTLESDLRYQALCRYESWLATLGFGKPHSWRDKTNMFDFHAMDALLMPGAALDDRDLFDGITFHGALVGMSESKFELGGFFEELGGQVLDSALIQGDVSFAGGISGLVMELHSNGVFIGRTPANQTESLAESARLYGLTKVWVRLDWLSAGRFKGHFSFFGALT